jgi:hypothetical protein
VYVLLQPTMKTSDQFNEFKLTKIDSYLEQYKQKAALQYEFSHG